MRIALDAPGGDHGAGPNVAGAVLAVAAVPALPVARVGDQPQCESLLAAAGPVPPGRVEIVHAPTSVDMKEKPAESLRKKPDASIFRCWQLMAEGKVDGLVSAGNTGAVVAGGLKTRQVLKSVPPPRLPPRQATAPG